MTSTDEARSEHVTARIRELNDQLRVSHTGGTLVTTPGVLALGLAANQEILSALAKYSDLTRIMTPTASTISA
jgi:hypothetical protein